jgi:exonuclease III
MATPDTIRFSRQELMDLNLGLTTLTPQLPLPALRIMRQLGLNRIPQTRRGRRGGKSSKKYTYSKVYHHKGNDLKFCLLNAQSIGNKTTEMCEYIKERKIDILAITETWIKSGDIKKIRDATPKTHKFKHVPRTSKRAGGVAVVYRIGLNVDIKPVSYTPKSFELMEAVITSGSTSIRLIIIYRPPPSQTNGLTPSLFYQEFADYLETVTLTKGHLLMVGDFNFHVDVPSDSKAAKFSSIVSAANLVQHIHEPTHRKGHTLDLLITRTNEQPIHHVSVINDLLSDHFSVFCCLKVERPGVVKKQVTYRKLKSIDLTSFKDDLQQAILSLFHIQDCTELISEYNKVLSELLDTHAPLQKAMITIRDHAPWQTEEINLARRERRQAERKWRKTQLTVDREIYKHQRQKVIRLIEQAKTHYYTGLIHEQSVDQKALFKLVKSLMGQNEATPLPPHESSKDLACAFGNFFIEKIDKIQKDLESLRNDQALVHEELLEGTCEASLDMFVPVSECDIIKLVRQSPCKSCCLDPLPTFLLKDCLDILAPAITKVVNLSLEMSVMPKSMKEAVVTPLLKKSTLPPEMKNYRPVSNLSFISKLVERVIAAQLKQHMADK